MKRSWHSPHYMRADGGNPVIVVLNDGSYRIATSRGAAFFSAQGHVIPNVVAVQEFEPYRPAVIEIDATVGFSGPEIKIVITRHGRTRTYHGDRCPTEEP